MVCGPWSGPGDRCARGSPARARRRAGAVRGGRRSADRRPSCPATVTTAPRCIALPVGSSFALALRPRIVPPPRRRSPRRRARGAGRARPAARLRRRSPRRPRRPHRDRGLSMTARARGAEGRARDRRASGRHRVRLRRHAREVVGERERGAPADPHRRLQGHVERDRRPRRADHPPPTRSARQPLTSWVRTPCTSSASSTASSRAARAKRALVCEVIRRVRPDRRARARPVEALPPASRSSPCRLVDRRRDRRGTRPAVLPRARGSAPSSRHAWRSSKPTSPITSKRSTSSSPRRSTRCSRIGVNGARR